MLPFVRIEFGIYAMDWLNYHHLLYFWTVAREGSIARAAKELRLASPTVHAQIRTLERNLGQQLLVRRGRGLSLTDAGRVVLGYADEIFSLGRELLTAVKQQQPAADRPVRFNVGVVDSVPKTVAKELLKPALHLEPPAHLTVREGKLEQLVAELATHRLDMVLADHPYNAPSTIRIFHHRLGECGVTFFAAAPLAAKLKRKFPKSLDGAPALLPTENTAMRSSLESWFDNARSARDRWPRRWPTGQGLRRGSSRSTRSGCKRFGTICGESPRPWTCRNAARY